MLKTARIFYLAVSFGGAAGGGCTEALDVRGAWVGGGSGGAVEGRRRCSGEGGSVLWRRGLWEPRLCAVGDKTVSRSFLSGFRILGFRWLL